MKLSPREIVFFAFATLSGVVAGFLLNGAGGSVLGGTAGVLVFWAVRKGAIPAMLAGAVTGVVFALLAGPGMDYLLRGIYDREKITLATVVGALVGAALGIKNYRRKKTKPAGTE